MNVFACMLVANLLLKKKFLGRGGVQCCLFSSDSFWYGFFTLLPPLLRKAVKKAVYSALFCLQQHPHAPCLESEREGPAHASTAAFPQGLRCSVKWHACLSHPCSKGRWWRRWTRACGGAAHRKRTMLAQAPPNMYGNDGAASLSANQHLSRDLFVTHPGLVSTALPHQSVACRQCLLDCLPLFQ